METSKYAWLVGGLAIGVAVMLLVGGGAKANVGGGPGGCTTDNCVPLTCAWDSNASQCACEALTGRGTTEKLTMTREGVTPQECPNLRIVLPGGESPIENQPL